MRAPKLVVLATSLAILLDGAAGYVAPVQSRRALAPRRAQRPCAARRLAPLQAQSAGSTPASARQRCVLDCCCAIDCMRRITTRELEIRRLESELSEARALLREEKRELTSLVKSQGAASGVTFRETTARSLVKAIGWRIVAGSITFASSLYFTKSLATALAIVASDFCSKVLTMFIGERLFNKVKVGRTASGEGVGRSVAKALIWRAVAFINTASISGLIAGSAGVGASIASFDAVVKTSLMVFYDQAWNKLDWGKELENVDGDGI